MTHEAARQEADKVVARVSSLQAGIKDTAVRSTQYRLAAPFTSSHTQSPDPDRRTSTDTATQTGRRA